MTITPVDITTTAGLTTITTDLVAATFVKVFGVPQSGGNIKVYQARYEDRFRVGASPPGTDLYQ